MVASDEPGTLGFVHILESEAVRKLIQEQVQTLDFGLDKAQRVVVVGLDVQVWV